MGMLFLLIFCVSLNSIMFFPCLNLVTLELRQSELSGIISPIPAMSKSLTRLRLPRNFLSVLKSTLLDLDPDPDPDPQIFLGSWGFLLPNPHKPVTLPLFLAANQVSSLGEY
ncbi:hypothetical protein Pfo_020775 [Paulownia fortunei]|nr:hypothetical protein Pfo_020775 [Paulownia fortunei]